MISRLLREPATRARGEFGKKTAIITVFGGSSDARRLRDAKSGSGGFQSDTRTRATINEAASRHLRHYDPAAASLRALRLHGFST